MKFDLYREDNLWIDLVGIKSTNESKWSDTLRRQKIPIVYVGSLGFSERKKKKKKVNHCKICLEWVFIWILLHNKINSTSSKHPMSLDAISSSWTSSACASYQVQLYCNQKVLWKMGNML